MDLNIQIETFVAAFRGYVSGVASVVLGDDDERYRKILYFSVLEGLSRARYPTRRPRDAFSSFVVSYCGWEDGDRISLPHIVAAIERTGDSTFESLRKDLFSRFQLWGSGGPLGLERDPTKTEIQKAWPMNDKGPLPIPELGVTWEDLQHRSLLYAYRSKLSHESREPSLGFDSSVQVRPFYNSVQTPPPSSLVEWHLVYPSGFLAALCRTGIEALKTYCLKKGHDPYDSFRFGHHLLDSLNDPAHPVITPCNIHA